MESEPKLKAKNQNGRLDAFQKRIVIGFSPMCRGRSLLQLPYAFQTCSISDVVWGSPSISLSGYHRPPSHHPRKAPGAINSKFFTLRSSQIGTKWSTWRLMHFHQSFTHLSLIRIFFFYSSFNGPFSFITDFCRAMKLDNQTIKMCRCTHCECVRQ